MKFILNYKMRKEIVRKLLVNFLFWNYTINQI